MKTWVLDDLCFDLSPVVARYWRETIRALDVHSLEAAGIRLVILNRTDALSFRQDIELIDFPQYDRRHPAMDRKLLSLVCADLGASIFSSSYHTMAIGAANLLPIYEYSTRFQEYSGNGNGLSTRSAMERELAINAANGYVALSESAKVAFLQNRPELAQHPVFVAFPGVDAAHELPVTNERVDSFRRRKCIGEYIVVVGGPSPRRGDQGWSTVLRMFANGERPRHDIVLLGGESVSQAEASIAGIASTRLARLDHSEADTAVAIRGAEAVLCLSSLTEAFEIIALDALATGTPVVTSSFEALGEGGGGDLLQRFDELDPSSLAAAIERATRAAWRAKVGRNGPARVAGRTWEHTAEMLVEAVVAVTNSAAHMRPVVSDFLWEYTERAIELQR